MQTVRQNAVTQQQCGPTNLQLPSMAFRVPFGPLTYRPGPKRIFNSAEFQPEKRPQPSRGRGQTQDQMPDVYRKVNQWSAHIQETGDSLYEPGSDLTVDEAMVRFTGRSLETTTIPTKPIPTGYKIWILAQSGCCIRWLWHVHGKGPYALVPQARPAGAAAGKLALLTPTQRVVTTLVSLLPAATYHVFLDNLFASIRLFRTLRKQQVGASGTCRKDSGIDKILGAEKETEGRGIPWGDIHCIPTLDGEVGCQPAQPRRTQLTRKQVNQFTWKDNALVLFLSTVFQDGQEVIRSRRRPAGDTAAKKAARQVFGPDVRKDLPVPRAIDEYNHKMNGVDYAVRTSIPAGHETLHRYVTPWNIWQDCRAASILAIASLRGLNMTSPPQRLVKKRDRSSENFVKATKNLLARCDRIREQYDADIYIQVHRSQRYFMYTSSNEPSWPKTQAEVDFAGKRSRASTICTTHATAEEENNASCCDAERASVVDRRGVLAQNHGVDAYSCDEPAGQEMMPLGGHSTCSMGK
ncbi:AC transposable element-derived protein 4 [Colletotrichum acutatum]